MVSSKPFRAEIIFCCVRVCARLQHFISSPIASKVSLFLTRIRHTEIGTSDYQLLPDEFEGFLQRSTAWNLPSHTSVWEFLLSGAEIWHLKWTAPGLPGKRENKTYVLLYIRPILPVHLLLPWRIFFVVVIVLQYNHFIGNRFKGRKITAFAVAIYKKLNVKMKSGFCFFKIAGFLLANPGDLRD